MDKVKVEEIKAKIEKFKKLIKDDRTSSDERDRYSIAVKKFEDMLESEEKAEEKAEEKVEKKAEEKAEKKAEKKVEKKVEKKAEEKVEKKAEKKPIQKGMKVLSSNKVTIDGKEVSMDSSEFCDYLVLKFRERREKAMENKGKKKKTVSVMSKIAQNVEKGITQAIKTGLTENKGSFAKNPSVFIGKIEKLETSTKTFLENLKDVLGSEFDKKEVTQTTSAIHDLIEELKKKIKK